MEWISVKDRLPETLEKNNYFSSDQVLIYDGSSIEKAMYEFGNNFACWTILFGEDFIQVDLSDVTHWMPLPEPPKQ